MAQAKQSAKAEVITAVMLYVNFAVGVTNPREKLEEIEGIALVNLDRGGGYYVHVNPCYDVDEIVAEIEQIT